MILLLKIKNGSGASKAIEKEELEVLLIMKTHVWCKLNLQKH